jgi:CO/xanthine dehydrogenase Mo-binding subunit/CO/xanthine dehydrogenase FAD-binding subunit
LGIERPRTLGEAWHVMAVDPAIAPLGGGTAAQIDWRTAGRPARILDLSALGDDLRGIALTSEGGLRIGALATLGAIGRDPTVRAGFPALAALISQIAGPSVRSLATIGGNVARIAGCAVPLLAALNARAMLWDGGGPSECPLLDWLDDRAAGRRRAILTGLVLPPTPNFAVAEKVGRRHGFSPSVVGVAMALQLDPDGRIASARLTVGAGVRPALLANTSSKLIGARRGELDWGSLREGLIDEIQAEGDAFRTARYKKIAAANALVMALGGRLTAPARRVHAIPALGRAEHPQRPVARAEARTWPVRPDIAGKVTGRLRYHTDRREDGMLVARVLRAGIPHATILRVDTAKAEALPGVRAVVTAHDVPGLNAYGIIVQDQPVLCFDKVRFEGDPVAAVAAVDAETAARALALIEVDYAPLPVVDSVAAALAPDSAPIHAGGNLHDTDAYDRGDVDAAWAACAHIVEDTYVTPRQMHVFMETEGGFARPTAEGGVEVFVGGQSNTRDRMQLARILDLPEAKIRVVGSPTGGAFGGKDELTVQPMLALLALKARAPVRLHLDREESTVSGWKRTPLTIRMRTGCDAEGRLIAQDLDLVVETGGYSSWSAAVMHSAMAQACGTYVVPNVRLRGRTVYTSNGVGGAFRGFGVNQMVYAIEAQVDRLAERAGLDAVQMRRLNLRRPGERGVFEHMMSGSERIADVLEYAAASDLWAKPRGPDASGRFVTGTGVALVVQALGLGSLIPDNGGGRLSLSADGNIVAAFSLDEFGQGVMALIQASVAAEMGCALEDIVPIVGDSNAAPDSGATIASRSTTVVGQVARALGPSLASSLAEQAALMLNRPAAELRVGRGGIHDQGGLVLGFDRLAEWIGPDRLPVESVMLPFPVNDSKDRNTLFLHSYAAAVARISVDRATGVTRVLDLDQHTAAGPVMDPAGYLGQFEGGNVQGMGFALTEDSLLEGGRYVTRNLDTYMVPTILDAPHDMRTYAVEALDPGDPYGARGIGELSIGAVAAAIANAVGDATGTWPTALPIDPEAMLDVLGTAGAAP